MRPAATAVSPASEQSVAGRDPVALGAGPLFVLLALGLLVGAALPDSFFGDGGVVWAVLIGTGVVLLMRELRGTRTRR